MKLIRHRGKGPRARKGSSAPPQPREKINAGGVDGGVAGSNSRQVAPDDVLPFGTAGYASSRDEAFFEASPWLESDCEDDFFSVNGDDTPARTFSSAASYQATQKLPTLEAILKAEPLKKPPPQQMKLGDLLKEKQEECIVDAGHDGLSKAGSSRAGDEATGRCCIPRFARAISYKERRKRR